MSAKGVNDTLPCESKHLISVLEKAVDATKEFEPSVEKNLLWACVVGIISETQELARESIREVRFCSGDLRLVKCKGGLGIISVGIRKVSINMIIPSKNKDKFIIDVFEAVITSAQRLFPLFSIDFTPIRCSAEVVVDSPVWVVEKRFVPLKENIKDMVLSEDGSEVIFFGERQPVVSLIVNEREVTSLPLHISRMSAEDKRGTLYWHRFPCGRCAAFENPYVGTDEESPFFTHVPLKDCFPFRSCLLNEFFTSLCTGNETSLISVLTKKLWFPRIAKQLAFVKYLHFNGITDKLIYAVLDSGAEIGVSSTYLSKLMVEMKSLCNLFIREASPFRVCTRVCQLVEESETEAERETWERWLRKSETVLICIHKLKVRDARKGCRNHPTFASLLEMRFSHCDWSEEDLRVAEVLSEFGKEVAPHLRDEDEKREEGEDAREEESGLREEKEEENHVGILSAVRDEMLGGEYECRLVGTGAVTDERDADIVVCVPGKESLEEAFNEVEAKSGLKRVVTEREFDETRVCILKGKVKGVEVDVQVWRGEEGTASEKKTQAALRFTDLLVEATRDSFTKATVLFLHRLFDAASLKGHLLCRFPGISVSALGLVVRGSLREEDGWDASSVARGFGSLFCVTAPFASVSTQREKEWCSGFEAREGNRRHPQSGEEEGSYPRVPFQVEVDETNTCKRVTAAWTRHLLDTVRFATALPPSLQMDKSYYTTWRRSTMFTALKVVPKAGWSTISESLFASLSQLDFHPLIDTVHVEECEGGLEVMAALKGDACKRYCFSKEDSVQEHGEQVVVTRGSKKWILFTSCIGKRSDILSWADIDRMGGFDNRSANSAFMLGEERACIPNAPFLSAEVAARFPPHLWSVMEKDKCL